MRGLSPPSYSQLLGTAVSIDADLDLEPPVFLSVWRQEVCGAVCPFLQHPLSKEGVTVARRAMLDRVAVLRPSCKSKIKLSPHMMLIPTDSFTEFSLCPHCLLQRQTTAVFLVLSLPLAPSVTQLTRQSDSAASPLHLVRGVSALHESPGPGLRVHISYLVRLLCTKLCSNELRAGSAPEPGQTKRKEGLHAHAGPMQLVFSNWDLTPVFGRQNSCQVIARSPCRGRSCVH